MENKNTYIYTLNHPITNEIRYIGKSNTPRKRLNTHIKRVNKTKSHKNNWIKLLLNENLKPIIKILDQVPMNEWEYWEKYWIEQFTQWGFKLVNGTNGGQGDKGYKHTEESKKKMSNNRIGIPLSDETKKKMSIIGKEYHKKNPNYNRSGNNLIEFIDKDILQEMYIDRNMSMPEISKELSTSETRIYHNLTHYNIKKEDGWWLSKISEQYKKVTLQYDLKGNLLKEWKGLVDIERELGFNRSNIANCCRGIIKSSSGFIWRYKDDWIELPDLKKSKSSTNLPVKKYSKEGNLLKEYGTIKDAANENNLKSYNIKICCEGKLMTHGGYVWKF